MGITRAPFGLVCQRPWTALHLSGQGLTAIAGEARLARGADRPAEYDPITGKEYWEFFVNDECYVYIVLPGETGKFIHGRSYRARENAVPIDPFELKLSASTFETQRLKGVFGALDYLLQSPDDRAGALGFGLNQEPPAPRRRFNRTMDLERLQAVADAIIADEELPVSHDAEQAQALLLAGTSMGGARPKAVVADGDGLWVAKFNLPDDRWNHARVERAMLLLARECGVQTAESRLETIGDRDVLLGKRFDREKVDAGYRRARMLSALTLLRADDCHQDRDKWSYVLLAEELRRISSQPKIDNVGSCIISRSVDLSPDPLAF